MKVSDMYLNGNYPLIECRKIVELIGKYEVLIRNIDVSIKNVENDIAMRKKRGKRDSLVVKIRRERLRLEYMKGLNAKRGKEKDVGANKKDGMQEKIWRIRLLFIEKIDDFCHKRGYDEGMDVEIYDKLYGMLKGLIERRNKYVLDIENLRKCLKALNDVYFSDKVKAYQRSECAYRFNLGQNCDVIGNKNNSKSKIYRR